jgi:hypothetical protein
MTHIDRFSGLSITVATWNLERPRAASWKKLPAIRAVFEAVDADVWILTESRVSLTPAHGYHALHSPIHRARRPDADERWVSIWSRWPISQVPTREAFWSTTGRIDAPGGALIVHGVVLPFHGEPSEGGAKPRQWSEYLAELERQGRDWAYLRKVQPRVPFILAGDLNQSLDGSRWYGTAMTRRALLTRLADAGLRCLTHEDAVLAGRLASHHLVDHVCVSEGVEMVGAMTCWEPRDAAGTRMSDHAGVAVTLRGSV